MHSLVVQHGHLKTKVLLHVLDDHDEVGQLDAQRLFRVRRARNEGGAHVVPRHLQHGRLNVRIRDALDVAVAD